MGTAVAGDRRVAILIGLALALALPFLPLSDLVAKSAGIDPMLAREATWWGLAALVFLYSLMVEGRGPSSFGLRLPGWRSLVFGVLGALAVFAVAGAVVVFGLPFLQLKQNAAALNELLAQPFDLRLAIVARAGVVEEFLFRGYAIERLYELTGSRFVAGLVPLVIFAVGHVIYWGPAQILVAGAAGLVLTLLYLWRRDLASNMVAHFIVDALGILTR